MSRFVEGEDRRQPALLPSCLEDYVSRCAAGRFHTEQVYPAPPLTSGTALPQSTRQC